MNSDHPVTVLANAAAELVRCVHENPDEECPFCELTVHDLGSDHQPDCPLLALASAVWCAGEESDR